MAVNIDKFLTDVDLPDPITDVFTPTLGQTIFILSQTPSDDNDVQMFVNSIKTILGTNYTAVGTTVTWLDTPYILDTSDKVEIVYFI